MKSASSGRPNSSLADATGNVMFQDKNPFFIDAMSFLLLMNQQPVGSVRWLPCETEPQVWDILRMGILPTCRGLHLSQHLIEAVIHHALESGAEELRLAIRADQPSLVDFYTAFGFEIAPELEYEHANPLEPLPHVMRKFL